MLEVYISEEELKKLLVGIAPSPPPFCGEGEEGTARAVPWFGVH